MTVQDAANLIIAVCGTPVTREAAAAINDFRPMSGVIYPLHNDFSQLFLGWLKPLGVEKWKSDYLLKEGFGVFLEFLISEAAKGALGSLLRSIPVAEIPSDKYKRWRKKYKDYDIDQLVNEGILSTKPREEILIGEDVQLAIKFVRSMPRVDVEIKRLWDAIEDVFQISFFPYASNSRDLFAASGDLTIVSGVSQHTVTALALALSNIHIPPGLKSAQDFARFFAIQEGPLVESVEAAVRGSSHTSARSR